MAEEIALTKEMTGTLKLLAEQIKATDVYEAYKNTFDIYTRSEELNRMVFEYNVHQQAITEEFKKDDKDQGVIDSITKRMNELYEGITNNADYMEFLKAQTDYEKLMQGIYSELDYLISGKKACTHDCSTCHSDCASKENKD